MKKRNLLLIAIPLLIAIIFTTACEKKTESKKYDYLVLVNKYSQLPDDWEKNVELVTAKDAWGDDVKIEKETYEQYRLVKM